MAAQVRVGGVAEAEIVDELDALRRAVAEERAALAAVRPSLADERAQVAAAEARLERLDGVANPKTRAAVMTIAHQFEAFVEAHGEAYGYDAVVGPTVELALRFQSHGFFNRSCYSTLGCDGYSDAWGELKVPYFLPKYGFPMLRLRGWEGLAEEDLFLKCRPYVRALKANWHGLKTSNVREGTANERSMIKERWCDGLLFLAQDACRDELLRINRAVTRFPTADLPREVSRAQARGVSVRGERERSRRLAPVRGRRRAIY